MIPLKDLEERNRVAHYVLSRVGTGLGVGWFACVPEPEPTFEEALQYSREHPNDLFMHQHLLNRLRELDLNDMKDLILKGEGKDRIFMTLCCEACLLNTKFEVLREHFQGMDIDELTEWTPMIIIPSEIRDRSEQHFYWLRQFSANANLLRPLPSPDEASFPVPFDGETIDQWWGRTVSIGDIDADSGPHKIAPERPSLKETAKQLTRRLEQLGILTGWDMRTEATLSPFAVERPWNLDIEVTDGRNGWRLTGTQTGYGRGLNISLARMSCLMEIVERLSAFANVEKGRVRGYEKEYPLIRGSYPCLLAKELEAVDPYDMCLKVPYRGQSLSWIEAERGSGHQGSPILVPAQMVFLFSNLDEASLTSGLPSNGLAAGNRWESARLSALLEVLERDAEKVVPYGKDRAFLLTCEDEKVNDILETCRYKGIHIQFLDITAEMGVPCYKAFIQGPGGVILKGTGAHLDGKRALLSALTEIPYPYPYWFGSMPVPQDLASRSYEDLPNYASGDPAADLALLERLLRLNGYHPLYVDLTRKDLGIPVVKAIVPGLEMMTVFDRFSPLGLRQFGHYLGSQRNA